MNGKNLKNIEENMLMPTIMLSNYQNMFSCMHSELIIV